MNITELDQYNLKDAVKFHARLNPRLWGRDEHLLPEVAQKLLAIAADFQEFLGVPDLNVADITISGSNAAYSYTPGSDIDLHLVVQMPDANSEVYQELFNAKKYQYNDEHDIRIGGADVELYVQPADQKHHSQGIYSVRDGQWKQVPRRRRADIDDHCVRHKTEDLAARIDQVIASGDESAMQKIWDKIKSMRQAGLEQQGEFGCDNLVFKMLRRSGHIEQLKQAKTQAHDRALSLQERKRKKRRTRYGFGGYWYPGFGYSGETGEGGGEGGGESMREGHQGQPYSSPDGVAASTQMFLNETDQDQFIQEFIQYTADRLGIESMPGIELHRDDDWAVANHSFGRYDPESHKLHVNLSGRHIMDVLRTTAHELAHCRQHEISPLPDSAGNTGSPWENQAHAVAGEIMRDWADQHPEMFDIDSLKESASGYIPKNRKEAAMPQYAMALSVDIQPGQVGKEANKLNLQTGRNGEPTLLMKTANLRESQIRDLNDPPGPEFKPTMPAGTVRVDVSDMYDWYKLGQHISNMKGLGRHDFGAGPPSTIFSFGDEDLEHQYIDALKRTGLTTTDIDPAAHDPKSGQKTDPTYNVAEGKMAELDMDLEDPEITDRQFEKKYGMTRREARELFSRTNVWDFPDFRDPNRPLHEQGVAEGADDISNQIEISFQVNQDSTVDVTAILDGQEVGHVNFDNSQGELIPQDLYVDPEYRGQGIAAAMYDYTKRKGYTILQGEEQSDDAVGFWAKHRPGENVWEQGVAEDDLVESLRQEFELLEDEFIGEIRMSPTNLRAEAAKTGALAGMEFEMIVPGIEESEAEPEPDFDQDERCRSISDAVDFFHDGEYNGRRDVERLANAMQEDYYEWLAEKIDEDFTKDSTEYIYQYLINNVSQEEIGDIIGEDLSDADGVTKQQAATAAERVDEDEIQPYFDDAKDWHKEEYGDSWDESDWLDATDLDTMQSIYNAYDIAWPHWNFDTGSSVDIDSVAQDFGDAVGMPVNASSSYHGARREPGKYVVEPDGSLEPNNRVIVGADGKHYKTYLNQSGRSEEDKQFLNRWQGRMKKQDPDYVDQDYRVVEYNLKKETGLEFVSPPLPIDQLFDDLKKVQAWAKKKKITTNYSTGLHINVSVPEFSRDKLDYVKLALLLGDEYVLDQFGRSSNTYARSALEKVRELVRDNPQTARALLDRMRGHMEDLATKAIHSGDTSKYTSINTKDGYIEFRSPGGDWLDENFDKVENTLLRFTVALKAAMDPEAYREEYLKKLYRLLEPTTEKDSSDTVRYFADYVAGKIPQTALRSFVKQARLKRDIARGTVQNQLYWWRVYKDGKNSPNSSTVEVVATNKDQAIDKAGIEWNIFSAENRNRMDAEPVRPYVEPAASISDEPQAPDTVTNIPPRQTDYENMLGMGSQAADANWEIVDRSNYQPIFLFIANTAQDALRVHERWLQAMGYAQDSEDYGFRERARPGSTLDIQRRRAAQSAQAAVQSATQSQGNNRLWQIVNSADGEVAYEFYLSRENNQQDANEVGLRWVRNNGDPNTSYSVRAQPQQTGTVRPQDQQGNTQWRILINGQEIHRFWNRANQGEANGVAQTWVLDQIRRGLLRPEEGAEVEVVPVTGSQT